MPWQRSTASTKNKQMKKQTKDKDEIKVPVKQRATTFSDPLKYKITGDEHINFTKEKAFAFLELKTFEGERAVRERHVQYLFDEWVAGRFLWQNIILASARLGAETYRINGQHTCWMRVNIPERYEPLKADVREMLYTVDSQEQLRALYSAFDRNATRSPGHISKVMLIDTEAGKEIPHSYMGKLVAGYRMFDSAAPYNRLNANPAEMVGKIEKQHSQLFNIVGRWFAIHYSEAMFIRRAAVIGAMFATFEKNVKASDEFWGPIANGLGFTNKSDLRYRLRAFLETHGHTIINRGVQKITQEDLYCTLITNWNHWRAGEESLSRIRATSNRPKVRS